MLAIRRKAVQAAERLPTATTRGSRRYASGHGAESAHGAEHGHHEGPKAESLGTQLYVVLAVVPLSIGVYTVSRPDKNGKIPALSRIIERYSDLKEQTAARNTLHTAMVEQAAFDRNLFQGAKVNPHVDLKFPEIFNTGSPYNISAGQGARGMDELVAHYKKENAETEEKRIKAMAAKQT